MVVAPDPLFLVSTHTVDEGIFVYRLADGDGHLELLHQYREIGNPFLIDIHPNGRVVYSVCAPGHAAALSLNRSSGELKLINTQPTRGGPCYIEVDPSGRMVVVANYTDGSVISYPLGKDGALGEAGSFVQHVGSSVHWRRQTEPHAHCIKVSGDGRFAFAADLGTDRINIYALDPSAGRLRPAEQRFARVPPESGPRHFAFSPDHRHGYVINEMGNTITAFAYDAERGLLLERDTVPTLPADFDGTSGTADLAFTPDGRYLYGTNRGHDSIAMFKVDVDSGVLSSNGFEPSRGEMPQNLTMTPDGKLLFVANAKGNQVVAFQIEEQSGKLEFSCETEMPAPGSAVLG